MAKKELLKECEGDDDDESLSNNKEVSRTQFPPNFVFGVATSAYQVHSHFLLLNMLYSDQLWSGYLLIFTILCTFYEKDMSFVIQFLTNYNLGLLFICRWKEPARRVVGVLVFGMLFHTPRVIFFFFFFFQQASSITSLGWCGWIWSSAIF